MSFDIECREQHAANRNGPPAGKRRPAPPIFVDELSSAERIRIRDNLRARRVSAIQWLLRQPHAGPGRTYLAAIHRLMARGPRQMLDVIDRWPVGFLLDRLHDSPELDERVFCRLTASLMFVDGETGFPLDVGSLTIPPEESRRLPCLDQNGYLVFEKQPAGWPILKLRFAQDRVTVEHPDGSGTEFSLPIRPDALGPDVEFRPFATAPGWEKPIIEDASMALIDPALEPHAERSSRPPEESATMPLANSLAAAHRFLQAVWPEVIDWVDLFVPAFVDAGQTQRAGLRLSGSFGPSSPIYLSEVGEPVLHAEDILHELQHERFLLYLSEAPCFGKWDDPNLYVSPYRIDPRPLRGLHLGLHAFLAVNELRLRSHPLIPLSPARISDMAAVHQMNLFACKTLIENEVPTAGGECYFAEVAAALERQHDAIAGVAGREMLAAGAERMRDHIARVVGDAPEAGNGRLDWAAIGPRDLAPGGERTVGGQP